MMGASREVAGKLRHPLAKIPFWARCGLQLSPDAGIRQTTRRRSLRTA